MVNLCARLLEAGSGFLVTMILCRYLKPDLFGEFAVINAIVLAFQPLVNLELSTILIREIAREPDKMRNHLGSSLILKVFLLIGFVICAVILDYFLDFKSYLRVAYYLAVSGEVLQQLSSLINTIFMASERMELDAVLTLIFRVISVTGVIIIVLLPVQTLPHTGGFIALFAVTAVSQFVRLVSGLYLVRKHFNLTGLSAQWATIRYLLNQSWIMGVATFCTGLSLRVDVYLLQAIKGPEAVSMFHVPHLFVLQFQIIALALVTALFPALSRWGGDPLSLQKFHQIITLAFRVLMVSGFWIAAGTMVFPEWIIRLIGGSGFEDSVMSLRILAWCIPILFLNYLCANTLTSIKRQEFLIVGAASSLLINVLLDLWWIPDYGATGAAWGTLTAYAFQLGVVLFFLTRFMSQPLRLFSALIIPAGLTASFCGIFVFIDLDSGFISLVVRMSLWILTGILLVVLQPASFRSMMTIQGIRSRSVAMNDRTVSS